MKRNVLLFESRSELLLYSKISCSKPFFIHKSLNKKLPHFFQKLNVEEIHLKLK